MLKKPALLILDDSLSAVDTNTEAEILRNVNLQTQHGSAIIIAHRISTLAACDEILVLEHGRIIERGTHDELIALGGLYAETALIQMELDTEAVADI
jgi:ATP-binding cassette subfamily B protein